MSQGTGGGDAPSFFPSINSPGDASGTPIRVVLDTNTVMALWVFQDPALVRLRAEIENGALLPVAREDALEELRRVLRYRQFAIDTDDQSEILSRYTSLCVPYPAPTATPTQLPACRDRDDQKFLEIARDSEAKLLISRDKALLRLDRHRLVRPLYRIVRPEEIDSQYR